MSTPFQQVVALFGRILLSAIFILSGVSKITQWQANAGYMEQHGMPAVSFLLSAAIVVEIVGGLAILLGIQTRAASFILFLYLIPTTLIFHNFWAYSDPGQFQNMMIHFLKNLAIMGGLLGYGAFGAGVLSIDAHLMRGGLAPRLFSRQSERAL